MKNAQTKDNDLRMARVCEQCPVCFRARRNQKGIAYTFVRVVEGSVCPYCRAYARVHGRKAYEPGKD